MTNQFVNGWDESLFDGREFAWDQVKRNNKILNHKQVNQLEYVFHPNKFLF